jgi:hypothetical protein
MARRTIPTIFANEAESAQYFTDSSHELRNRAINI